MPLFHQRVCHIIGFMLDAFDRPKCIIKTLHFEHASQNASGFRILLHSIVYEWIFGTRVLSTVTY